MHRRRLLVHRPREELCQGARGVRTAHRTESGSAISDCGVLHRGRSGEPYALESLRTVRCSPTVWRRSEHGEIPRRQSLMGSGERLFAISRRIWLRRRVRYRTQISRDASVSSGTDIDQSDLVLYRRAHPRFAAFALSELILETLETAVLCRRVGRITPRQALFPQTSDPRR